MSNPEAPAPSGRRRTISALLGLLLAAGLLVWALQGVHVGDVIEHLRNARPVPLLIAVVLATLTFPLRLVRWRVLLRAPDGSPFPAAPLWHAVAIGFMANNLLPFRTGEIIRLMAATRLAGARFSAVLSSVAVERIFDALAIVALLTAALFASNLPPDVAVGGVSLRHAAQATGALGAAGLVAAALVVAFPIGAERVVRRLLPAGRLANRTVATIEGIRHGMLVLRSPAMLAAVVAWSVLLWMVNALAFYVGFAAFNIPVGYWGALLVQGVLVFGISVQLTPGYLGQFEAAIVAGLALYRIPAGLASSYAIAFHATTFLPIVLLGAWSLARTPLALSDLRTPARP